MPTRPSVLVLFDHGRGPSAGADWEADPEAFPYGYGYGAPWIALTASENAPEHRVVRFLRRGLAFTLGFDVVHAWRNRTAIASADAVITHTEHEHLAIAVLVRLGLVPRVPVVGQSIWLWDHWASLLPPKRALYRWLLATTAVHTVHSPVNAAEGSRRLGSAVRLVPYGAHVPSTAPPFVAPPDSPTVDVVAPGSDRHRDWRTLVAAAAQDPRLRVTIVSRRLRARLMARRCPDRVRVVAARSSSEVREQLLHHAVVAVPLKPNKHVSGLTVLFESFLTMRPVAISRTGGSPWYGEPFVDWATARDPASLVRAIHRAHTRKDDRDALAAAWDSVLARGLTMKDYGLRHVLAVWIALGRTIDPALLSLAEPMEPVVRREAERLAAEDALHR